MFKNYYEKLGLQDNASDDEIKKAYKKLAIKYHPDKQINSSQEEKIEAEKNFKIIAEAYEILTNKDKYRKNNFSNIHSTQGFVDPHEIFNQIFRDMNIGNIGNIGNRRSNISISIPQNIQGSCVMKTSSISIQNGRKVETIQETINGVTKQRVIITDLNNNIK